MSDKRTYIKLQDHGSDISFENEVKYEQDDRGSLDLTKQIETLTAEKVALYEKVKNIQNLEDDHQKLNGKLRLEVANLKQEIEKLKKDQDIKNDQYTFDILEKDNEIGRLMKKITERV